MRAFFLRFLLFGFLLTFVGILVGAIVVLNRDNLTISVGPETVNPFLKSSGLIVEFKEGQLKFGSKESLFVLSMNDVQFRRANEPETIFVMQTARVSINPLLLVLGETDALRLELADLEGSMRVPNFVQTSKVTTSPEFSPFGVPDILKFVWEFSGRFAIFNSIRISNSRLALIMGENESQIDVQVIQMDLWRGGGDTSIMTQGQVAIVEGDNMTPINIDLEYSNKSLGLLFNAEKIRLSTFSEVSSDLALLKDEGNLKGWLKLDARGVADAGFEHRSAARFFRVNTKPLSYSQNGSGTRTLINVESFDSTIANSLLKKYSVPMSEGYSLEDSKTISFEGFIDRDSEGSVISADMALQLDTIMINQSIFSEPWQLSDIEAEIKLDRSDDTVVSVKLMKATLNLASLSGRLRFSSGQNTTYEGYINVGNIDCGDLLRLIPTVGMEDAHEWMRNSLTRGYVEHGSVSFHGNVEADQLKVSSQLTFHDMSVQFLTTMPPLRRLEGRLSLDERGVDVYLESGYLRDLLVKKGSNAYVDYSGETTHIRVNSLAAGPTSDFLAVLDHDPIGLSDQLSWSTEGAMGNSDISFDLMSPVGEEVTVEDVNYVARVTLNDFAIPEGPFKLRIDAGNFDVEARSQRSEFSVIGTALIDDSPAEVTWHQSGFREDEAISRKIDLTAVVLPSRSTVIGFSLPFSAQGSIQGKLDWSVQPQNKAEDITFDFDLANLEVLASEYGIAKLSGVAARLVGTAKRNGKTLNIIDSEISYDQSYGHLTGKIDLDAQHFTKLTLEAPHFGHHVNLTVGYSRASQYSIFRIDAAELDMKNLKPEIFLGGHESAISTDGLILHVGADRVQLSDNGYLYGVDLILRKLGNDIQHMSLSARNESFVNITVRDTSYEHMTLEENSQPSTSQAVTPSLYNRRLVVNDIGTVVERLWGFQFLASGGRLVYDYLYDPIGTKWSGKLDADKLIVNRSFGGVELFEMLSIFGVANALQANQLSVDSAQAEIVIQDGVIYVRDGQARAIATAFTLYGNIDFSLEKINFKGTVAPLYQITKLIGSLPLIQQLISDPGSGALLATNFSISGAFNDVVVRSNPLSTLLPGFLKHVIDATGDTPKDTPLDEELAPR